MNTYQHSGAVPVFGAMLTCTGGLFAAVIGGVIYTYATVYIPIVYLNFLFTLAFGGAIGFAVHWGAKHGKVRNSILVTAFAWLFALAGLYVEWGITPLALGFEGIGLHGFDPFVMKEVVMYLYEEGSWGISDDEPVRGIFLVAVWLVEAGAVIGFAHYMARHDIVDTPFCERCDKWTEAECKLEFRGIGRDSEWEAITGGSIDALSSMKLAEPADRKCVRLTLWSCESCDDSSYLTIQRVEYSEDSHGNFKEKLTPMVRHLILDARQTQVVRDCGGDPIDHELDDENDVDDA